MLLITVMQQITYRETDLYAAFTDLFPEYPPGILALHSGAVLSGKLLNTCSVFLLHQGLSVHAHENHWFLTPSPSCRSQGLQVCTHTNTHTYEHLHACTDTPTHMSTHAHTHEHTCMQRENKKKPHSKLKNTARNTQLLLFFWVFFVFVMGYAC